MNRLDLDLDLDRLAELPGTVAHAGLGTLFATGLGAMFAIGLVVEARDGPQVDAATLTVIAAACRDHERLRFGYLSHEGTSSRRVVEPHRLVSWGRRWYLVGWDVDRQDWRTFRVDRIEPQSPTGPRFVPRDPPDGDFAAYVSRRLGTDLWPYEVTVRVHAPASAVTGLTAGTVEPVDEASCLLTLRGDSLNLIAAVIGMLDLDFDLVGPPEFADALRSLGDRYHRAAGLQ